MAVPIYQTVTYAFDSAQHGANLFDLFPPQYLHTHQYQALIASQG